MRHRRRKFLPPPPAPPDGSGERALAASTARLEQTQEQVVRPLRELNDRNNVIAIVRLISRGQQRGHPAAG